MDTHKRTRRLTPRAGAGAQAWRPDTRSGCEAPIAIRGSSLRGARRQSRRWRNARHSINNPLKYVDPSGHDWVDALSYVTGVLYGWGHANLMALGPIVPQPAMQQYEALAVDSTAFTAGRVLGGLGAVAQGIGEAGAGLTAIGGGGLFCTTGVGCLLGGGEAVVAGGVVLAHGASAAVAGAAEAGDQLGIMFAKKKDKPKSEELSSWNQSEAKRLSKKSLSEQEKALKQYEKTLKEHEKKYADSLKQGQTSKEVNTLRDIMKFLTDLITSRKK